MKTSKYFINRNEKIHNPAVKAICGRYGYYCKFFGNSSEKQMEKYGYRLEDIDKEEVATLCAAYEERRKQGIASEYTSKMKERFDSVALCLEAKPVAIVENEYAASPVIFVANLKESSMIDAYCGCGKGTAYIKDNKVIAFHYGYEQPTNIPEHCKEVRIELSGGQICFF